MSAQSIVPSESTAVLQLLPAYGLDYGLTGHILPNSVPAGFPSPAEDLGGKRIDIAEILITHPQATYFLRVSGQSMVDAGIFDKDIMVVNRAIKPRHGHFVVAVIDGDFTVKQLYQRSGRTKLKAANPTYPDITPKDGQTLEVWGVVTATIRQMVN